MQWHDIIDINTEVSIMPATSKINPTGGDIKLSKCVPRMVK
jgi:hypothetical protein